MEDLTQGFTQPSVIDIKIGEQTWEPGAPDLKIEAQKASTYLFLYEDEHQKNEESIISLLLPYTDSRKNIR